MPHIAISDDSSAKVTNTDYIGLAKKLEETYRVYVLYGFLDGISCSYGTCKWFFDIFLPDTNPLDTIHEWMNPAEIAAMAASALALTAFSTLASIFSEKDKDQYKRCVAQIWGYLRNLLKGLKNAYKGFRSTLQLVELLGIINPGSLLIPIGLLLGSLSAINRMWIYNLGSQRKGMTDHNNDLVKKIQERGFSEDINKHREEIKQQQPIQRLKGRAFLSATFGGIIDGLYSYIGVITLCPLVPPALIAMTVFSAIYFLACIATRIYEEYTYQRKLTFSQAKVELALFCHEMELFRAKGLSLSEMSELAESLEVRIALIDKLCPRSYKDAFFTGLRNGLSVYCAIACLLFTLSIFFAFPSALLIAGVTLGMASLITCVTYSLIQSPSQITNQAKIDIELLAQNSSLLLEYEPIKLALNKTFPSTTFFNWCEVTRSFFSGISKGAKALIFIVNFFQVDEKGDIPITLILATGVSAIVYAIILAARSFARSFTRSSNDRPVDTNNNSLAGEMSTEKISTSAAKVAVDTSPVTTEETWVDCNNNKVTVGETLVDCNNRDLTKPITSPSLVAVNPAIHSNTLSSSLADDINPQMAKKPEVLTIKPEKPSSSRESGLPVPGSHLKHGRSASICFFPPQKTFTSALQKQERRGSLSSSFELRRTCASESSPNPFIRYTVPGLA